MSLSIKRGVSTLGDSERAAEEVAEAISDPSMSFAAFFCASTHDLDAVARVMRKRLGDAPVIGCTTAGELTPAGYLSGSITGVSISSPKLEATLVKLGSLSSFHMQTGAAAVREALGELQGRGTRLSSRTAFAFLLVDGLTMHEEMLVSALSRSLGDIPLFGGSAGDGDAFRQTHVYYDGQFHTDAAVMALIHTDHPFSVFKTEHFVPSDGKMVVTKADPARRIVYEINGEPAGPEYARMVGVDVEKLNPWSFSAHPVVVRVGGQNYVRSIQKLNDDHSLKFFCAIDRGIVLTTARGVDLVENLDQLFADLGARLGPPALVLGCDCMLRNLEAEQRALKPMVSDLLVRNHVIGFSTYGEQFNAMHVNQTFTGVAIGG